MNKITRQDLESGLSTKSDINHTHDTIYATKTELTTGLNSKSDNTHNHDNVYMKIGETPSLDGYITKTQLQSCNSYQLIDNIIVTNRQIKRGGTVSQVTFNIKDYYKQIQSYYYDAKGSNYGTYNGYIQIYITTGLNYNSGDNLVGMTNYHCVYNSILHVNWDEYNYIYDDNRENNYMVGGFGNNIVLFDSKIFSCTTTKSDITIKYIGPQIFSSTNSALDISI